MYGFREEVKLNPSLINFVPRCAVNAERLFVLDSYEDNECDSGWKVVVVDERGRVVMEDFDSSYVVKVRH